MGDGDSQAFQLSNSAEFSKSELERYSRQILLYGRSGQQLLKESHILVIGAGGLGSTFLPVIAASGIGRISIWDADTVERSNLGRQLLYQERDIGRNKAMVAAERLSDLNPHIRIEAYADRFTEKYQDELRDANLLFEGSDSLSTKFLLNDLALRAQKSLVTSALGNAQGHTMLIVGGESACYRCVFEEIDETQLPTCANEGILSAFPAFVAAQAAHVAIRQILAPELKGGFWVFEKNHCRNVQIQKRIDCLHP